MPITLHDAIVPSSLQILESVRRLLGKAEAFCGEQGWAADEIIEARLAPDMLPFAYQVKSCAVHSLGAIEGVRAGTFSPDMSPPPADFAALTARIVETMTALEAVEPDEMESFVGREMNFVIGGTAIPFEAQDFLLSFSKPNFDFHATAAYAILRGKGLPIGKRDFLGKFRKKG